MVREIELSDTPGSFAASDDDDFEPVEETDELFDGLESVY